ncbi:hypothetical protein EBQ90_10070, partial [bacterium]|nr:hypothetical protein [bacterium]
MHTHKYTLQLGLLILAFIIPQLGIADFVVVWEEGGAPKAQTFPDEAAAKSFMAANPGFNFKTPEPVSVPASGNNSANNGQLYPSPLTGQLVSA